MPTYDYAGFKFHTSGSMSPIGTRQLIISSHGTQTGGTFSKAYPAVIQFAAPKGSVLLAALSDAINGNVTSCEIALKTGGQADDYKLSYYEHDPSDTAIDAMLNSKFDVLTFKKSYTDSVTVTLSKVLTCLKGWGFLYPGILCLFCRGQQRHLRPIEGGKAYAPAFTGVKSGSSALTNQHQINATAIMLEIQGKRKV